MQVALKAFIRVRDVRLPELELEPFLQNLLNIYYRMQVNIYYQMQYLLNIYYQMQVALKAFIRVRDVRFTELINRVRASRKLPAQHDDQVVSRSVP